MSRKNRLINNVVYNSVHNMLKSYLLGGFRWEGLPDGLTSQQMEQYITMSGMACGFNHPQAGTVILPAVWGAPLNLYYLPNNYMAYGAGWSGVVDADLSVAFYDNSSRRSLRAAMEHTEKNIYDLINSERMNISHSKNPWIFAGTEDEAKGLIANLQKVDENTPAYVVTGSELRSIETAKQFYPTNVKLDTQTYLQAIRQELNSFLTQLGYDNITIEKKERLITDEAHSNDASVMFHRADRLRAREEAAEKYNAMFNANLRVEWVGCNDCNSVAGGVDNG